MIKRERPTNDEKFSVYIQDDENTMKFLPGEMMNNKFFGNYSVLAGTKHSINHERQMKLLFPAQAYVKAKLELGSQTECFGECIHDFENALSADEKNCMRECTFKKVQSKNDLAMMYMMKSARETSRQTREAWQ